MSGWVGGAVCGLVVVGVKIGVWGTRVRVGGSLKWPYGALPEARVCGVLMCGYCVDVLNLISGVACRLCQSPVAQRVLVPPGHCRPTGASASPRSA